MHNNKPDYSVFLQIYDGEIDWWLSPNITLIDDNGNTIPLGSPTPVGSYTVEATVYNLGMQQATNVSVKFFWRDAGMADASSFIQLGSTVYLTIPGMSSGRVRSSEPLTLSGEGSAHKCILVNCSHYLDPIPEGNEFNAQLDRHVAQRNVSVIMGIRGKTKKLTLISGISKSKYSKGEKRLIMIRPKSPRVEISQFKQLAGKYKLFPSKKLFKDVTVEIDGITGTAGNALITNLEPGKDKNVKIKMTIPRDADKGETWAFVVTQERLTRSEIKVKKGASGSENIEGCYTILIAASH